MVGRFRAVAVCASRDRVRQYVHLIAGGAAACARIRGQPYRCALRQAQRRLSIPLRDHAFGSAAYDIQPGFVRSDRRPPSVLCPADPPGTVPGTVQYSIDDTHEGTGTRYPVPGTCTREDTYVQHSGTHRTTLRSRHFPCVLHRGTPSSRNKRRFNLFTWFLS